MRVCLTGGAGFIGSHILVELLAQQHDVLVIDNFANSSSESLLRVEKIVQVRLSFWKRIFAIHELFPKL